MKSPISAVNSWRKLNFEGELTEELQEQLAINRSDFEEKAEVYIISPNTEADQTLAQSEIDRLSMFKERKSKSGTEAQRNASDSPENIWGKDRQRPLESNSEHLYPFYTQIAT